MKVSPIVSPLILLFIATPLGFAKANETTKLDSQAQRVPAEAKDADRLVAEALPNRGATGSNTQDPELGDRANLTPATEKDGASIDDEATEGSNTQDPNVTDRGNPSDADEEDSTSADDEVTEGS